MSPQKLVDISSIRLQNNTFFICHSERFPTPFIPTFNQTVNSGGSVILECNSEAQVDSYQWFHHNHSNSTFEFDINNSIGNGQILEINKISTNYSGLIFCCALYSTEECKSKVSLTLTISSY